MGWLTGWFRRRTRTEAPKTELDGADAVASVLSGEAPARQSSRRSDTSGHAGGVAVATPPIAGGAAAAAAAGAVLLGAEVLHALATNPVEARTTDPVERAATETGGGRHEPGATATATHDAAHVGGADGRPDPGCGFGGDRDDGDAAADGGDAGGDGGGD